KGHPSGTQRSQGAGLADPAPRGGLSAGGTRTGRARSGSEGDPSPVTGTPQDCGAHDDPRAQRRAGHGRGGAYPRRLPDRKVRGNQICAGGLEDRGKKTPGGEQESPGPATGSPCPSGPSRDEGGEFMTATVNTAPPPSAPAPAAV